MLVVPSILKAKGAHCTCLSKAAWHCATGPGGPETVTPNQVAFACQECLTGNKKSRGTRMAQSCVMRGLLARLATGAGGRRSSKVTLGQNILSMKVFRGFLLEMTSFFGFTEMPSDISRDF